MEFEALSFSLEFASPHLDHGILPLLRVSSSDLPSRGKADITHCPYQIRILF